jgi:hypothetical protein
VKTAEIEGKLANPPEDANSGFIDFTPHEQIPYRMTSKAKLMAAFWH